MKVEFLLILLLVSSLSAYKITKLKCECTKYAIENYYYPNYTCSHHNYDPKESTYATAHFWSREPIVEHWTVGTIETRLNGKYVKVIDFHKADLCKEIKNIGVHTNPLFMTCYNAAKEIAPEYVHPCPYDGIHADNASIDLKHFPSFLLRGEFRSLFRTYATEDENTLLCTVKGEFTMNE